VCSSDLGKGTSGTEQSRVIIIDKGSHDGVKADMAVITPDGIVGKVKDVFPISSQVLLINDHDSGAGVILESSRLQGVLKGTSLGELQITDIMSDEKIEAGEHVISSGGDRIFPKGISVGPVISASPFMNIRVKPSADLRRLEEVLVVTKMAEETPAVAAGSAPIRAADILSQRLPSIPKTDPNAPKTPGAAASPTAATTNKPAGAAAAPKKESVAAGGGVNPPASSGEAAATKPAAAKPASAAANPTAAAAPTATPGKTAAGTATTGAPGTTGTESKKPAGQTSTSGAASAKIAGTATASGSPGPTPTPKPKAPAKKKAPASPEATPGAPESKQPEAAPAPTPERTR
jgi:rod shape-determining protein MreC